MWGDFWDGVLESGGELINDVTEIGSDWLGVKVQNEAKRVESSNPDEQRKHNNDYQQATGEPVNTPASAGVTTKQMLFGGLLLVVVLLAVLYVAKGKK